MGKGGYNRGIHTRERKTMLFFELLIALIVAAILAILAIFGINQI